MFITCLAIGVVSSYCHSPRLCSSFASVLASAPTSSSAPTITPLTGITSHLPPPPLPQPSSTSSISSSTQRNSAVVPSVWSMVHADTRQPSSLQVVKTPITTVWGPQHSLHTISPDPSSSKQAKALRMTSSGSVPLSLSPNIVRNMVKLIGPGASLIIPSRYSSDGFLPLVSLSMRTRLFTQRSQHVMQILLIDEAIPVLVNHVEGLFEFLDLRLVEVHGESFKLLFVWVAIQQRKGSRQSY
ncbi:hypothetical protein INR49_012520 [Caranx melampygus]|nr:hypothetical protein INR49_012520 [Caranx melampygus]